MTKKTLFFEELYNADIADFSTTHEIDQHIEKKLGRKLQVINSMVV